jgi:hypothetical protein
MHVQRSHARNPGSALAFEKTGRPLFGRFPKTGHPLIIRRLMARTEEILNGMELYFETYC